MLSFLGLGLLAITRRGCGLILRVKTRVFDLDCKKLDGILSLRGVEGFLKSGRKLLKIFYPKPI